MDMSDEEGCMGGRGICKEWPGMKDRVVCVMSVGAGKYLKQYELVKNNIMAYAKKCRADFRFIHEYIDQDLKRDIYSQKLLIPDYLREYEQVLFLDLDIIISPDCPDIFELMPENIGLMAEVNPRESARFRKIYAGNERILNETVQDYFCSRGFPEAEGLIGNINGGVLLFRPRLVADLFKEYYLSMKSQGENTAFEEAPMAYYTQTKGLFAPLEYKFNCMPYFEIGNDYADRLYRTHHNKCYCLAEKVLYRIFHEKHMLLIGRHYQLVKRLFADGACIVHFAGGYWNAYLYRKCMKHLWK